MSIKHQEEEVKLLTETCKSLFTLFLMLSAGLIFLLRTLFEKTDPSVKVLNGVFLFLGIIIDTWLFIFLVSTWGKIKKIIKEL